MGNGTDALFLALEGPGHIGQGDEVIASANTFIATTEPITAAGARVVLVDVDPDTYNMDPGPPGGEDYPADQGADCPCTSTASPPTWRPSPGLPAGTGLKIIQDSAQAHSSAVGGKAHNRIRRRAHLQLLSW